MFNVKKKTTTFPFPTQTSKKIQSSIQTSIQKLEDFAKSF